MATGYTQVSGSKLTDSSGNPLNNATIKFSPCAPSGAPLSFQVGGGGQAISGTVTANVVNGAFSVELADTTLTNPQNICYAVSVTSLLTSAGVPPVNLLGPGYLIQPSGSTWSFDSFVPNLPTLALIQTGPAGPAGAPGTLTGSYAGPLSLTTVTIGSGTTFESTPSNAYNYVDAVVDSQGNAQSGVLPSGQQQFNAGLAVVGGAATDTMTVGSAGTITQQSDIAGTGYIDPVTDSAGNMVIGYDAAGNVHIGANCYIHGGMAVSGTGGPLQGFAPLPLENLSPSSSALANLNSASLNVFLVIGQSLASGFTSNPALTTTQNFANVMLNGGVRQGLNGATIPSSSVSSLAPLVEANYTSGGLPWGETIAGGCTDRVAAECMKRGVKVPSGAAVCSDDGQPYSVMAKGTQTYNNAIQCMTAFANLKSGSRCRGLLLVHGETDDEDNITSYQANLATWQSNYQSDINSAMGTNVTIPMYVSQEQSYGSVLTGQHTITTVDLAMLAAVEGSPSLFRMVCPKYFLTYTANAATNGGVGVHLTGVGERILGEYYAKAVMADMLSPDTQPWTGLRPVPGGITLVGNTIMIDFYVPVGPLVIDTLAVSAPNNIAGSMYGFEFTDGSSSPPAIVACKVVGASTVMLTLSGPPNPPSGATMYVSYAYTAIAGQGAGATTGPRGNLRDSDSTPALYDGRPLYNWCVTFHKAVTF